MSDSLWSIIRKGVCLDEVFIMGCGPYLVFQLDMACFSSLIKTAVRLRRFAVSYDCLVYQGENANACALLTVKWDLNGFSRL